MSVAGDNRIVAPSTRSFDASAAQADAMAAASRTTARMR
jgi:hypothetical protein